MYPFISWVFVVLSLEMNFEFSAVFEQLKQSTYFEDMDGKYLLSRSLRWENK